MLLNWGLGTSLPRRTDLCITGSVDEERKKKVLVIVILCKSLYPAISEARRPRTSVTSPSNALCSLAPAEGTGSGALAA